MNYVKQFSIILLLSFLGEVLHGLIPLPIPASIYGIVLLFLALVTGVVKLSQVKEVSHFLIDIMPVMFIPSAVGLMDAFGILLPVWLPYVVITVCSTILVMGVAGRVTQAVAGRSEKKTQEPAHTSQKEELLHE
jgi:holin-like protein